MSCAYLAYRFISAVLSFRKGMSCHTADLIYAKSSLSVL